MNLNPLYELKERLESAMIAGVSLLSEDFRLARAVGQMEPLAKASPVFQKIYQGAQSLVSGEGTDKSDVLLDVLALADAVLTTQAAVAVEGPVEPLAAAGGPVRSDAPCSQLAPILEALTTTGSGHYSLIVDTHDRNPGIFSDYRLKPYLIAGLNAGYTELAERMEEWLGQEDGSLLPLLKDGFDPKGKKEMVRRVHVVEAIAGAGENGWYLSQLEEAEKDVRAALIQALRHTQENREALIALSKSEKGNCKKAAMWALAKMEGTQNLDFWEAQMKKKPDTAAKYLALATDDGRSELVAQAIMDALDKLQAQLGDGDRLLSAKDHSKLLSLFSSMVGKASPKMLDAYRRLASDSLLGQMEMEKGQPVQFLGNSLLEKDMDMPVSHFIAGMLAESILWCMDSRLLSLAGELYQSYGDTFLKPALITALLTAPQEEVYNAFATRLAEEGIPQKETARQKQLRLGIMEVFALISWDKARQQYVISYNFLDESKGKQATSSRPIQEGLHPGWFEILTDPKIKKSGAFCISKDAKIQDYYGYYTDWDTVLANLINPQNQRDCQVLGEYFYKRAYTAANDMRYYPLLRACGYYQAKGLVVRSLKKGKNHFWNLEYMMKEIPLSTEDKLEELEEVKKMVEGNSVRVTGWSEEKYQELYTRVAKGM